MKHSLTIALASSLVLAPAAAQALEPSASVDGVPWPRAEQNRIALEYDFWGFQAFNADIAALTWAIPGQIRIVDRVFIDFAVPWTHWHAWDDNYNEDGFAFGNLTVGAHFAAGITDDIAFWAGGKLSVPTQLMDLDTSTFGGNDDDWRAFIAASWATATRGGADAHRFYPEHISLPFGGGIEVRFVDFMYYRGSLVPAIHFPVDGDAEFYTDQVNEIEARADFGLGGGLRVQEIFFWTETDKVQLAIEPFFGYESPGAGFIFRLGVMVALEEDLGFGTEEGKVASFRSMFGGKF